MSKLKEHAELTIKTLEHRFKGRGRTTGLKKWELELLFSAYEALEVELKNRKFGLHRVKDLTQIEPKRL